MNRLERRPEANYQQVERLPSPLWLRAGPVLPESLTQRLPEKFRRIVSELGANPFSSDLSPYRSGWVMGARELLRQRFDSAWMTPVGIDYDYSTTTAAISALLQIRALAGPDMSIYIERPEDGWQLRQFNQCSQLIGRLVDTLELANVVFLTHGSPEMGLTSLETAVRTNETQYIIIDSASEWPTLFLDPYKSIVSWIMRERKAVIIGDFQKVFGYAVRMNETSLPTPMNFALMVYSPSLFHERLSFAERPTLEKTPNQLEHWQIVNTRTVSNSTSGAGLLLACSLIEEFGSHLSQWTKSSLSVAKKLREIYQVNGGLSVVAGPINEGRLFDNNPGNSFTVSSGNVCWEIEDVVPTFSYNERLYGFFHVYPIYSYLGEQTLFNLYDQIAQKIFSP